MNIDLKYKKELWRVTSRADFGLQYGSEPDSDPKEWSPNQDLVAIEAKTWDVTDEAMVWGHGIIGAAVDSFY